MGHQAQERAYRPEEPKGSPPPPRRSLYPAAAARRVSTDTRGRSNEIKTLPMIRIRLASAPGRCYIRIAVCTPAGEAAPRRISGAAAPKEQPPRKLSGKRTAGARALWKAAGGTVPAVHRRSKPRSRPPPHKEPAGSGESLRVEDRGGISRTRSRPPQRCARVPVSESVEAAPLRRTPLYDLHRARGARMVPFAGYEMPVQYPAGIMAEHLQTRAKAGLFDVSHMGQIRAARRAARRRRWRRWCPAICRPRAGPHALHAAAQRGRRHPRRSDGRRGSTAG